MNHPTEDELLMAHYGGPAEAAAIEEHLRACQPCRSVQERLLHTLDAVDDAHVPDPPPDYEARLWAAIEPDLAPRRRRAFWQPLAVAASVTLLAASSLLMSGRSPSRPDTPPQPAVAAAADASERILLVAVGNHLERSQAILTELSNSDAPPAGDLDISYEQSTAQVLVEANRLYRQTAASAGDIGMASLLDDLERTLLEVAHSPSEMNGNQLEALRSDIAEREILFKLRIFGSQVERRQQTPSAFDSTTL